MTAEFHHGTGLSSGSTVYVCFGRALFLGAASTVKATPLKDAKGWFVRFDAPTQVPGHTKPKTTLRRRFFIDCDITPGVRTA